MPMTVFEINRAINDLIDENGEVIDVEKLVALQMEKSEKAENIALAVKNLTAEANAIAAEIKTLTERKKAAENKASRLKEFIAYILEGEKLKTARVAVSYRKTSAVEVDDGFLEWAMTSGFDSLLSFRDPEPSKTAIKEFIADGNDCPVARIVERNSVTIK